MSGFSAPSAALRCAVSHVNERRSGRESASQTRRKTLDSTLSEERSFGTGLSIGGRGVLAWTTAIPFNCSLPGAEGAGTEADGRAQPAPGTQTGPGPAGQPALRAACLGACQSGRRCQEPLPRARRLHLSLRRSAGRTDGWAGGRGGAAGGVQELIGCLTWKSSPSAECRRAAAR